MVDPAVLLCGASCDETSPLVRPLQCTAEGSAVSILPSGAVRGSKNSQIGCLVYWNLHLFTFPDLFVRVCIGHRWIFESSAHKQAPHMFVLVVRQTTGISQLAQIMQRESAFP